VSSCANGQEDDLESCEHISYAELNRRANLLAAAIKANAISNRHNSTEPKIGISMQPGTDLIVGILAILKTGACYVPIDPGYPQARIAYLLEDSQVSLVISDAASQRLIVAATEELTAPVELMLLSAVDFAAGVAANPTSGSTGKPKAVLATHGNVASLVAANVAPIDADSRVLCAASVSFDAFTFELWCTLLNGAQRSCNT